MILWRAVLLAAQLLVIAAPNAYCLDATMGRYDPAQTSYTAEKLEPPLALLWDYAANKYDNNPCAPIVANGVAYLACGDRIYAVDVETGKLWWKYPREQGLGGTIKGTPAVVGGNVLFGSGDGNLYCIDAATGTFKWAYQTRGAIRCPPVVEDGIVYIGTDDNSVYAVQADSGDAAWNKPFVARDDFGVGLAVGAGMVVAACMDGNMYGISTGSGKLRWIQRLSMAPSDTCPVISDNIVIMAIGAQMTGYSVRSGQLRWSMTLPADVAASPAVDGSDIYVPCKNKKVYAYTALGRQISLKWTAPADLGTYSMSSPTIAENMIYVTSSKGVVSAFSITDGSLKWRYVVTPSPVTMAGSTFTDAASSPIVAEGSLFVATDDGVLHRFTQDAPDSSPPEVYSKVPKNGTEMSGAPPIKMSAVFYDMGSGVDFSSVAMYLDDQPVDWKIDPLTATISYTTETGSVGKSVRALKDGVHTITVTAKDYKGNKVSEQWYIIADSTLPPPKRAVPEDAEKKTKEPPKRRTTNPPAPQPVPGSGENTPPPMPPMPPPPAPGMPEGG